MQLISKSNEGFRFLFYVIDVYSKYAWINPLENEKVITITMAFREMLDESERKRNKIWVGNEFYNRSKIIFTMATRY